MGRVLMDNFTTRYLYMKGHICSYCQQKTDFIGCLVQYRGMTKESWTKARWWSGKSYLVRNKIWEAVFILCDECQLLSMRKALHV